MFSPASAFDPESLPQVSFHPHDMTYYSDPYFANGLYPGGNWLSVTGSEWGVDIRILNNPQFNTNGYPRYLQAGQKLRTWVFGSGVNYSGVPATWPTRSGLAQGRVELVWQGDADIRLSYGTFVTAQSSGPSSGRLVNGHRVYLMTSNSLPSSMLIYEINSNQPPADIKVWLPDPSDPQNKSLTNQVFHPTFMARLADADWGYIRSMNLVEVNGSPLKNWEDRRVPGHVFMCGILNTNDPTEGTIAYYNSTGAPVYFSGNRDTGIAYEYVVALANQAGKDLWINVPHLATTNYIRKLAQLILFGSDGANPYTNTVGSPVYPPLDPDRRVFIEFSNEIWSQGAGFCQGNWAQAQATNIGITKAQFNARKFCDTWSIFQDVFGGTQRLVRVAAVFTAGHDYSHEFASEVKTYGTNLTPKVDADVMAIATYFGNGIQDWVYAQGWTTNYTYANAYWTNAQFETHMQLAFDEWERRMLSGSAAEGGGYDAVGVGGGFDTWAHDIALSNNWPLVAYEGGPSIYTDYIDSYPATVDGQALTIFMQGMNRHPRMRELYDIHLNMSKSKGLWTHSMFTACSKWSKYGQWGHLEYGDQNPISAVKYKAVMDFMDEFSAINHIDRPAGSRPGFATAPVLMLATANAPYSVDITVTGTAPLTASVAGEQLALGLTVTNIAGGLRIQGIPQDDRNNYLMVRVVDADGDPAWQMFTFPVVGGLGTLVQSRFEGTNMASTNIPWTRAYILDTNKISFSGWTLGSGFKKNNVTNEYQYCTYTMDQSIESNHTLSMAILSNHYVSCTITPVPGLSLDLRGATVRFGIKRIGYQSPRNHALMNSLAGFTDGAEIYDTGYNNTREDMVFNTTVPNTPLYAAITNAVEWRIYGYHAQFGGQYEDLTLFKIIQAGATQALDYGYSPASMTFAHTLGNTAPPSKTFTVTNIAMAQMHLSNIWNASWLSVTPVQTNTLPQGQTASFTVSILTNSLSAGTSNTVITLNSTNSTQSPGTISVQLQISTNPPVLAIGPTNLSFSFARGGSVPAGRIFTVTNSGQGSLTYTVSSNASWLSVSPAAGSGVISGQSVAHTVSINTNGLSVGTSNATLTITSPNANNSPRQVDVSLTVTDAPELNIFGNNTEISSGDATPDAGDHTDFGELDYLTGIATRTFEIRNPGNAALNLTGTPRVVLSGSHTDDFTVTGQPVSPVAAGSNTTFSIEFNPVLLGTHVATVTIYSSDSDENPYTFTIQGGGTVIIPEVFPVGSVWPPGWVQTPGSEAAWQLTTNTASEGDYSLQSGAILDYETSAVEMSGVFSDGNVTFSRKVSSEAGWDFLRFYVDNVEVDKYSGELDWAAVSYAISAGSHTCKWAYTKDASTEAGQDCAWIDEVALPLVTHQMEVSTNLVTVNEGSNRTFQIRFTALPPSDTTVTVSRVSGDADITLSTGSTSLLFTAANGTNWQTVTLNAAEDPDYVCGTAYLVCSSPGLPNINVTAAEFENDLAVMVSASAVTVAEGGIGTFQANLSTQPSSAATVTVSRLSGDTNITVSGGASLVFTTNNWSTWQTVTLAASDDADSSAGAAVIRLSGAGITNADVTATERDKDGAVRTVLIDCGPTASMAAGNWNDITSATTGIKITNAMDSAGANTGIRVNITDAFAGTYTDTISDTNRYPAEAKRDCIYVSTSKGDTNGILRLENLTPGMAYNLTFYGYRNSASSDRRTLYTVGASSVVLNAYANLTNVVTIAGVVPDASSNISIRVNNYISGGVGYLNVLEINYIGGSLTNPAIGYGPSSLTFSHTLGSATPVPQTFSVTNAGFGILQVSNSVNANWLSVSPVQTNGLIAGQSAVFTVSILTNNLLPGTSNAVITLVSTNAENSLQTIAVQLNIAGTIPVIGRGPGTLTFNHTMGSNLPPAQSFYVTNTGFGVLHLTNNVNASWLSVSPVQANGIAAGQSAAFTVSILTNGLAVGTNTAIVSLTSTNANNSPQKVDVTLIVARDSTPPTLASALALSSNQVTLVFSEAMEQSSAENAANYTIPGLTVQSAVRGTPESTIILNTSLVNPGTYTVTVVNVRDVSSNTIVTASRSFAYVSSHTRIIEVPVLESGWWQIGENSPDVTPYNHPSNLQNAADFTIFQATNGNWELVACIRGTTYSPGERVFHRWENTGSLTNTFWTPKGLFSEPQSNAPVSQNYTLQAPHCFTNNGEYYMFYNSGYWNTPGVRQGNAAFCYGSRDGVNFTNRTTANPSPGTNAYRFFEMGRDVNLFSPSNGTWLAYYAGKIGTSDMMVARSASALEGPWSTTQYQVRTIGNPESPFALKRNGGYYLFQQMKAIYSEDPLNFDKPYTTKLTAGLTEGKYAPEVFEYQGQWYISGYANGIWLAKIKWVTKEVTEADLIVLSISGLTPAFDSTQQVYTSSSANASQYMELAPADSSASLVMRNGGLAVSNSQMTVSGTGYTTNVLLGYGANVIQIDVSTTNGVQKAYYIKATRTGGTSSNYFLEAFATAGGALNVPMYSAQTAGSTVTVMAAASEGWHFVQWTGSVNSTSAAIDIAMTTNKTVTAVFEENNSFVLSTLALTVPEGSNTSFQVKLAQQPTNVFTTITVSRISGDTDIMVGNSNLVFTKNNWAGWQAVTVSAAEDADSTAGAAVIRLSGSLMTPSDVTVTEQENDFNMYNLTVDSAYGTPGPTGTTAWIGGVAVACSVGGSPVSGEGFTQYVCTGWTMSGQSPVSGSATNFSLTITNDATLTWLWETNVVIPPPSMSVGSTNLVLSFTLGGAAPAGQTFAVTNTGYGALHISSSDNAAWLSVTPAQTNSLAHGQSAVFTVSILTNGLSTGTSNAVITLISTNANNSPKTVAVELTVLTPVQEAGTTNTLYFDFGASATQTTGNWNNITKLTNGVWISNAISSTGEYSGIKLAIVSNFNISHSSGIATNLLYPATAVVDSFRVGGTGYTQSVLQVTVPDTNRQYYFNFFGCSTNVNASNLVVDIGGQTGMLNTRDNLTNRLGFASVYANSESNIMISLSRNGSGSIYGYLSVMEMWWIGGGGVQTFSLTATANNAAWGGVSPTGGVYNAGSNVQISATASNYYHFVQWNCTPSDPSDPTDPADTVLMHTNKTLMAVFAEDLLTNGTPAWWLAQYGLATNDAAANADGDGDGLKTWQEYVAGTDPTNRASVLQISGLSVQSSNLVMTWQTVSGRLYSVYWSSNLLNGFQIAPLVTNLPPAQNVWTDSVHQTAPNGFYRIQVLKP